MQNCEVEFLSQPFGGLRGNVDASCVRRWKKHGRLHIGDNSTLYLALTAAELRSGVFEPLFGGSRGKVGALYAVGKCLIDFL